MEVVQGISATLLPVRNEEPTFAAERGSGEKDRPKGQEFKQKFWEILGCGM